MQGGTHTTGPSRIMAEHSYAEGRSPNSTRSQRTSQPHEEVPWAALPWCTTVCGELILWTVLDTLTLTVSREKTLHQHGDQFSFLVQCDVTGMQEMHLCLCYFACKGQGTSDRKERIVLPPYDECGD